MEQPDQERVAIEAKVAFLERAVELMNEVILEHCFSLDTLITDCFGQYGIAYEVYGDMSSFTSYTGHHHEGFDRQLQPHHHEAHGRNLVGSSS